MDRLLLDCIMATRLWWDMFSWFGMSSVMPRSVKDRLLWNIIPMALMCGLFEGVEMSF